MTRIESPLQSAGPRRLWEDSHQSSGVIQDRIHIPGRIQFIAGGRYDSLRDHNYSAYASCAIAADLNPATASNPNPCAPEPTDKPVWLPQFAVTFSPVENLTLYSNYGVMLSLGPQAPFWADNGSQFLAPFFTRQAEIGAKYEPGHRILLTTAFFHMRAPFFYPESDGAGGFELCLRRPRNAQRSRTQRRRQSRQLAAAQRLGRGHERYLHRYRHANLR